MKKNNKKLYLGFIITLVFFAFLVISPFFSFEKQAYKKTEALLPFSTEIKDQSFTLIAREIDTRLPISPNTLLYDALEEVKNTGKITLLGKNHPGLGFFVTEIGSLHSGNGKNLLYYINGKEATVGVSSYKLKDGDIIEWKLE